ncbi:MAG: hypothetical protein ACRCZF_04460, partial [Gemmataceae bacterium]
TTLIPENLVLADFFAFESTQRGGVTLSAGNFIGSAFSEVVVGAGPGGGPRVRILDGLQIAQQGRAYTSNGANDTVANFFAFESTFRNGINVSASPTIFTSAIFSDLVVTAGPGGGPRVRVLNGTQIAQQKLNYQSTQSQDVFADFFGADPNTRSGLSVAMADFTSDGVADVAIGTGAGLPGQISIYDGGAMRTGGFTGIRPGDLRDQFTVNPTPNSNGPAIYTNGVTVGAAFVPGAILGGALTYGLGGQGRISQSYLATFSVGSGFLQRREVYSNLFNPTFFGPVNVSN